MKVAKRRHAQRVFEHFLPPNRFRTFRFEDWFERMDPRKGVFSLNHPLSLWSRLPGLVSRGLARRGTCSVILDPIDLLKRIELAFIASRT